MNDPFPELEESRAVALATAAAALLVAEQVAARAVRDALFLSSFRVRSLPFMMMASALVALAAATAISRALGRRAPSRSVPAAAAGSALLLLLLWPLVSFTPRLAAVLVYLHVAAFGGALVSGFWSLVNERFDPFTARRVVGRIGAGATAGGVAGGLAGWLASQLVPVPLTLLGLAALHAGAAVALSRVEQRRQHAPALEPSGAAPALAALGRTPYLRQVALVVALGTVTEAVLDWSFKAQVQASFAAGGGHALLAPLSMFYTGMAVISLLVQLALARPALQRLGIAQTLAVRPTLTAVAALLGTLSPRLLTATLARGAHEALSNSLFRSAYELLYTPVPEAEKRRIKAFVDMALDKAGALLGGGLVLGLLALAPHGADRLLFAVAALLSVATLVLSRRLQPGYVQALERSLLLGSVQLDPSEAVDRTTQLTLAHTSLIERSTLLREIEQLRGTPPPDAAGTDRVVPTAVTVEARPQRQDDPLLAAVATLRSGEPEAVLRVLQSHPEPDPLLVAALVPLLADDRCAPEVVAALRRVAPRAAGQLVDVLLDRTADPRTRRRVARVLRGCAAPRALSGLHAALDEPSLELRAAAAASLAASRERGLELPLDAGHVFEHVRRELDSGLAVDRQLPHVMVLLSLVLEQQPLQIAWAAIRGTDPALRGTALEYLANVLPDDVFPRVRSLFGASAAVHAARQRTTEQLEQDLRRSAVSLPVEAPPWRDVEADPPARADAQSAGS